jgi:preprotein translocase subunit SecD
MKKTTRFLILAAFLVGICGFYFLKPSIEWYTKDDAIKKSAQRSRESIRETVREQSAQLWDSYVVFLNETPDAEISDDYKVMIPEAKRNYKKLGKAIPSKWTYKTLVTGFINDTKVTKNDFIAVFDRVLSDELIKTKEMAARVLQLGLDLSGGISTMIQMDVDSYKAEMIARRKEQMGDKYKPYSSGELKILIEQGVDSTIETLRDRIDKFGVGEVSIKKYDNYRVGIDLPGVQDPDRMKTFLKGKGALEFRIVDRDKTVEINNWLRDNQDKSFKDFELPAGLKAFGHYETDSFGLPKLVDRFSYNDLGSYNEEAVVINMAEKEIPGRTIRGVYVNQQSGDEGISVNFSLEAEGAKLMESLTEKYLPKKDDQGNAILSTANQLAVIVNDKVKSYPRFTEKLGGGSIRVSGGFSEKEAYDLAKTLRTGSLDMKINIVSQYKVSPALGKDQRNRGLMALLIGGIAVLAFMLLYYLRGGVLAIIAMAVNMFMLIAILAGMGFTFTLPGIAALILTIGMSVDANVIIFERIKEEYMLGKSSRASVQAGFSKASWTIIDANVTTFIAALALSIFGSGAIKGFANVLAVGIVTSMISALFVSRLMFDFSLETLKFKTLILGWRRRKNEG